MAKLTTQDTDNYKNFKKAADSLKDALKPLTVTGNPKLVKDLFYAIHIPESLKGIGELEELLDRIESYIVVQNFLLDITSLNAEQKLAITNTTQELISQFNLIKESLQDFKDADLSTLDDLGFLCSDEQFLRLIEGKPREWTKALLGNHSQNLDSNQITQLTDAWGIAVSGIVKDAQDQALPLKPGTPDTIARFFCIHEELEDLYDKVSDLVA